MNVTDAILAAFVCVDGAWSWDFDMFADVAGSDAATYAALDAASQRLHAAGFRHGMPPEVAEAILVGQP